MSVLHELDPKGIAYENGERAEDLFARICASRGYTTIRTSQEEDCLDHIDYWVKTKDIQGVIHEMSVDVKGLKHNAGERQNGDFIEDIWVEFVSKNHKGWLYGKADWVAFQQPDNSFLMVNRQQLVRLMNELKGHFDFTWDQSKARGNYYVRTQVKEKDGRYYPVVDILTLVDIDEIRELSKNWPLQMMEEKQ